MIINAAMQILMVCMDFLFSLVPWKALHVPQDLVAVIQFIMNLNDLIPIYEGLDCAFMGIAFTIALHGMKWGTKMMDLIADVLP
jgi:hypothetical protein